MLIPKIINAMNLVKLPRESPCVAFPAGPDRIERICRSQRLVVDEQEEPTPLPLPLPYSGSPLTRWLPSRASSRARQGDLYEAA